MTILSKLSWLVAAAATAATGAAFAQPRDIAGAKNASAYVIDGPATS